MVRFLKDNGLTVALMLLFLGSILGHWLAGLHFHNQQLAEHGQPPLGAIAFLADPQFLSTVFENWESEFLQMSAYVVLTSFLFQRGSAESGDPDAPARDGDTMEKTTKAGAPTPMRKGPVIRWFYAHSLGTVLLLLFIASFTMHWIFSARDAAEESALHGEKAMSAMEYLTSAQLWFESFQNWQSEFLSTAMLVVLSIFLRQQGSPESKPVAAPHSQTGS